MSIDEGVSDLPPQGVRESPDPGLPPSLRVVPNLPPRLQTLSELRAEELYWRERIKISPGAASAGACSAFLKECMTWIALRNNQGVGPDERPQGRGEHDLRVARVAAAEARGLDRSPPVTSPTIRQGRAYEYEVLEVRWRELKETLRVRGAQGWRVVAASGERHGWWTVIVERSA